MQNVFQWFLFQVKQEAGDYIITWGFHWGWNSGCNLNEAINFVTDLWLKRTFPSSIQTCRKGCTYTDYTFNLNRMKEELAKENPMDFDSDEETETEYVGKKKLDEQCFKWTELEEYDVKTTT